MAKKLSPMEQKASSKVLSDLRGTAQDMMKGKMNSLKKVTVASDSKEGLKKGLELAKKIAGKSEESDSQFDDSEESCPACSKSPCECEESDEEESSESPELEASEDESSEPSHVSPEEEVMSAEELDRRIQALLALKAKKK